MYTTSLMLYFSTVAGAKESFHELQDLCDVLTEGKSKKYCLFIAPLAGHLSVDVHDEAWAVLNIGILSTRLDVVRIQLCFKGKVEYDLNILGVCINKQQEFIDGNKIITNGKRVYKILISIC